VRVPEPPTPERPVTTDSLPVLPYGAWPSPLTAATLLSDARALAELRVDGDDVLWLERRPSEGGRQVVVRSRGGRGEPEDLSPADVNVRTRVHEYGGGCAAVRDGVLWYVAFDDQRVWRQDPGEAPRPLTALPATSAAVRFAEPALTPDGRWLVCVRERHLGAEAGDVVNDLVAIRADGADDQEPLVLLGGHDFVGSPVVSPGGTELACVVWDHPNMPWDDTTVIAGALDEVDGSLGLSSLRRVAGAPDVSESAIEPTFSPDGTLHLLADRAGWWQLYREEDGAIVRLCDAEVDLGGPRWTGGARRVGFLDDGRPVVVATDHGVDRVCVLEDGRLHDLPFPHGTCRGIEVAGSTVTAIVAAADSPFRVLQVDVSASASSMSSASASSAATDAAEGQEVREVHRAREVPADAAFVPVPETITFPTADDAVAHALYYRPTNPDVRAPEGELPPLLVLSHGGPTGHVSPALNLDVAYWTSRGFAVADVNYRGSTGYGRAYREALRGRWGEVDVDDCTAVATWLAERGEVDGAKLAIRGGSAGGFTTLAALTFGEVFSAGASHFGVADLGLLAEHTHKFESRYLDRLVGPWPQAEATYRERSPLHHTEQLSAPMIVLQGLLDRIVPPEQAHQMVAALDAKGVPHAYVEFPDEDHGFRKAENVIRALESELSFYGQVFGFEPADDLEPVEVRHLGAVT
jgi:dipeptidyl aminopeptidase/acylaminoacyl peptidase